jgi:hypothetical protein
MHICYIGITLRKSLHFLVKKSDMETINIFYKTLQAYGYFKYKPLFINTKNSNTKNKKCCGKREKQKKNVYCTTLINSIFNA